MRLFLRGQGDESIPVLVGADTTIQTLDDLRSYAVRKLAPEGMTADIAVEFRLAAYNSAPVDNMKLFADSDVIKCTFGVVPFAQLILPVETHAEPRAQPKVRCRIADYLGRNAVQIELIRADLLKIMDINAHTHTFKAMVFLQLAFVDGALDDDLSRPGREFPYGPDKKPTFRPSAGWYMEQIELSNALLSSSKALDKIIKREGDDITLNLRYEATFYENFELVNYPFDAQDLTMALTITCRSSGPLPVKLAIAAEPKLGCISEGFQLQQIWSLRPYLRVKISEIGPEAERKFPTFHVSAVVIRKPAFTLVTAAVPFFFFTILASLQLVVVDPSAVNHRASTTLTMVSS